MKTLLRRLLFIFLGLVGLVALFYAEEDLRGWVAWKHCKQTFAAKGVVLDWNAFIPPSVPDDQNFFKAPNMSEWFIKGRQSDLAKELANPKTSSIGMTNDISSEAEAQSYLAWSDKFQPQLDQIREALKRPYARMDGDYHYPAAMPIPNFVTVRIVAQTLAQRAHCHLLLNQPDLALNDSTLLHDLCRLLEGAPTGKPMTLVAAMINVAVTGLYVNTIAEGMRMHEWQEPQLVALQKQLADINLTPFVLEALTRTEPAGTCRDIEIQRLPLSELFSFSRKTKWSDKVKSWLWPHGWTYQNMVNVAVLEEKSLDGFDVTHDTVAPHKIDEAAREVDKFFRHNSPYKMLAAIVIPNFTKAEQTAMHNQTMVNEAQIACALERYRLANGTYPETLDAFTPQFIEKVPHDIIGGQPLQYRRTDDGKFLLYSVGWNETDDGGQDVSAKTRNGGIDFTRGDWVWKN